jgi:O-antigen/teichoic acid export membrane protein
MINSNSVYNITRSLLGSAQFFLLSVLVIYFTSIENWGAFINSYLVWSICVLIFNSGTKDFLIKSMSVQPATIWEIISGNIKLRILGGVISSIVVLIVPIGGLVEKLFMILVIFLKVLSFTFEGLIIYHKEFKYSFFVELFSLVLMSLLIIAASYFVAINPTNLLGFIVISEVFKIVWYERLFEVFKNFSFHTESVFHYAKRMLPFIGAGIIGLIMNKIDLYIVGLLIDDNRLIGQYHVLNTFANLLIVVVSSLFTVRNKVIFRIPLSKFKNVNSMYSLYAMGLTGIGIFLFSLLSNYFFQFEVSLFQLFAIAIIVMAFSSYFLYIYLLMRVNKMYLVNKIILISGMVNMLTSVILIPYFKLEGALIAAAISNLLALALLRWYGRDVLVNKMPWI